MFEFGHPGWLLGLLLLPLVRWLHRLPVRQAAEPVPALFPWRDAARLAHTGPAPAPPDPAWRRRAAWIGLVLLALADPGWWAGSSHLTLWIDDSFSNRARDQAPGRLAVELDQALALAPDGARVAWRVLSDPLPVRPAGSANAVLAALGPPREAGQLPGPDWFEPGHRHWLLSDGADPRLPDWLGQVPVERVVQAGASAENTGLGHLSLRHHGDGASVLVSLSRHGSTSEHRELRIEDGRQRPLANRALELAPGTNRQMLIQLPGVPARLVARLDPADSLPEDDRLELDTAALAPIRIGLDADCPAPIGAAIAAHPGLVAAGSGPAELELACGQRPGDRGRRLWVPDPGSTEPLRAAPVWRGPAPETAPRLDESWLRRLHPAPPVVGDSWLSAGGFPLLWSSREEPGLWVAGFDLAGPELVRQPVYPGLVAHVLGLAAGRSVVGSVAVARPAGAAVIQPRALSAGAAAAAPSGEFRRWYGAPVAAALLLILYELWRLRPGARRWSHA